MSSTTLQILIQASDHASSTLKGIQKEAGGLSKALGTGLKVAAVAGAAGVAVLAGGLTMCVKAAMESQKIMAQTNAVLASTQGVSGMTAKSVTDLATELSKVIPIDDELIQSAENMLLTFTNIHKNVFPQATEAALNMATALGGDPVDAAMKLGKALNDPIAGVTALRKVGVALTDQQKDQIKAMVEAGDVAGAQTIILKELETEFGNSGRAAGETMGGQLKILQTQFGNLQESIGMAVIPILLKLASFLTDEVIPALQGLADEWIPRIQAAFTKLGDTLGSVMEKIRPFFEELSKNKDTVTVASAIIGGLLVGAFLALAVAAGSAAVGVIAATWPLLAIGVAAAGLIAGIVLLVRHWDDITAAVKRARDWFLNASPPIKALAVVLALPAIPIIALIAIINRLVTRWDATWKTIKYVTGSVVNFLLEIMASLLDAIGWLVGKLADLADKIPDAIPGAHALKDALHGMEGAAYGAGDSVRSLKVDLDNSLPAFARFINAAQAAWQAMSGGTTGLIKTAVAWVGNFATSAKEVAKAIGGPGGLAGEYNEMGGAAGDAAKALDDAAKAALEAHKAFVTLIGTTTLYNAMAAEATVTELRLADTIYGGMGAQAERKNLLEAEIGILQRDLAALKGTGDANDILRDSIQGTIDRLQEQIDAVDSAKNKWILFGSEGLGPVSATINAMNDAISEQVSGIQGLLSVETQEEAGLIARIANYDARIAGLNAVTAATEALTKAEQDRLAVAQGRSESGNAEIERIQDQMDIITEMERRRKENGQLTVKEQQALVDALRKLNQAQGGSVLTLENVHERMQERIWDLQQETERSDETVDALNKLADTRTKEGKAAVDALMAERDPLAKRLAAIQATKEAEEKGIEARANAFPTMEQWTEFLVGEGIEHGIITDGVLRQIPALKGWATTHGQTVFDISKGLQLLELAQDDFLLNTTTLLGDWTTQWAEAAALVAASMASVGAEPATPAAAIPALQGGGYIRRGGLALLHAGELVTPARSVRGPGGAGGTTVNHYHIGESGVFMGDTYAMKKLAEWMRAQGFVRKQDLS